MSRCLIFVTWGPKALTSLAATSYRPDKNRFVKQQIRRGIGPADTLTQLDKGNSPGRYVTGIYLRVWPQQLSDQMGPDKS